MHIPSLKDQVSAEEWPLRVDLAASPLHKVDAHCNKVIDSPFPVNPATRCAS